MLSSSTLVELVSTSLKELKILEVCTVLLSLVKLSTVVSVATKVELSEEFKCKKSSLGNVGLFRRSSSCSVDNL